MKTWLVVVSRKSTPIEVDRRYIEAASALDAAKQVEGGPVRFFYKDENKSQYVGRYLYEVVEL